MSITTTLRPTLTLIRAAVIGVTALGVVSLAPTTTSTAQAATVAHHRAHMEHRALRVAHNHLGAPYRYGAAGPSRFDCSGLTYFSFRRAGFKRLPRTSSQQAHFARHIRRSHLRRGDLIFFRSGGGVYHVGIYAGRHHHHRTIIHAPSPGKRVRRDRLWTNHWFAGTLR